MEITAPASLQISYRWDQRLNHGRGGYRSAASGRVVAWNTVRESLDRTIANAEANTRSLCADLREGRISLAEWQLRMRDETRSAHVASYVLQRGGWQQMSQADYGRVGRELRDQYKYLNRFAQEIKSGKQRLDGTLQNRALLYIRAGRHTFHKAETKTALLLGFDQERYVLHPADHCRSHRKHMGCVERAAASWQPIGLLPDIGECTCHSNDRCTKVFRDSRTRRVFDPSKRVNQ